MDVVIDSTIDPELLKKFEKRYEEQCLRGKPDPTAAFEYAWGLIRAPTKKQQRDGVELLEALFKLSEDEIRKRDYLYFMAIGCTRIKEYEKALRYVDGFLHVEPNNNQAKELKKEIEERMKKDGLRGMAVTGGAFAVGGLLAAGIAAGVAFALKK